MGIKQIETSVFIQYLKSLGIVFIRVESSHSIYDYPDGHEKGKLLRPITIRKKYKEIPVLHIHTSLQNAGISKDEFAEWLNKPKKQRKAKGDQ